MTHHATVWIDQHEAKIFHFDGKSDDAVLLHPHHHVRRPGGAEKNPADAQHFYHAVAKELETADEILVVGPATAKLEFIKHVHKHDHALGPKVIGVETVDHPTDGQIQKYARAYFLAADRMR